MLYASIICLGLIAEAFVIRTWMRREKEQSVAMKRLDESAKLRNLKWGTVNAETLHNIAVANGGSIVIVRYDKESKEFIEETITADMPIEEIVV